MKVIFHINEVEKYHMLASNINNLLIIDSNIDIKVVANGEAVVLFKDKSLKLTKNVSYYICHNSLEQRHIDENELNEFVEVTPSGVYKIAELENEGYGYIKP